eukprot:TRINITY_DN9540_c0_g1_i2.p2 TRINITY_DN9540_c0_g1~~TRINITY_DN9540_c0_g1_i2.p2  ORF type:complete len:131 (+),score=21.38 TRINITY_DN9540_c0_g1_i2:352-744(+)
MEYSSSSPISISPYQPFPFQIIDDKPVLLIIDPLNAHNNVGRAAYKIMTIKKAFFLGYCSLRINDAFLSLPHYLDPIDFALKKNIEVQGEKLFLETFSLKYNCPILKTLFLLPKLILMKQPLVDQQRIKL